MGQAKAGNFDINSPHWYILWTIDVLKAAPMVRWVLRTSKQSDYQVWIPFRKVESVSGRISHLPLYPGYMFIRCIWTPRIENEIRSAYHKAFFLKVDKNILYIMSDGDLDIIKTAENRCVVERDTEASFSIGDDVRILSNPFSDQEGIIDKFSKKFAYVRLSLLGRVITIPFSFEVLEKVEAMDYE